MIPFPVGPQKAEALRERMLALGVREDDIDESFIRSGGRGGQNVNKTATCVYLKHLPTGLEVKCQRTRTQGLNRYYARVMLIEKIDSLLKGRESEEQARISKVRRQKRKRSARAKEKMLRSKRLVSEKKTRRGTVSPDEGA